jgi:hypothetical protein
MTLDRLHFGSPFQDTYTIVDVSCVLPDGTRIVNGFTRGYRPDADSVQTAVSRLSRFVQDHHDIDATTCSWSATSRTFTNQGA